MRRVTHSALVPFTAEDMFTLVADIKSYPRFLPWCSDAVIEDESADGVQARLEVSKGPVRKTFTTRNRHSGTSKIVMDLIDGPFRHLQGYWKFETLGHEGCRVELYLEFEFANRVLARLMDPMFNEIANTLVDAFCRRAGQLYGAR